MKKTVFIIFILLLSIGVFANITFPACSKLCLHQNPGKVAKFYAEVLSDKTEDVTIKWYIYKDLNQKTEEKTETLHLIKDIPMKSFFYYKTDENDMWGYEAEFVVSAGEETYSDCIYYCVGKKPQIVGHYGRTCNRCAYPFDVALDTVRLGFKGGHCTTMEWFSWQPSCWETMAPPEP